MRSICRLLDSRCTVWLVLALPGAVALILTRSEPRRVSRGHGSCNSAIIRLDGSVFGGIRVATAIVDRDD